ncbi:MAG: hypothetical protein A2289_09685 [Deltaproteobacteria bacterium RIFOXYA12_FULL_58_15]|nr:MAG: hypothetical protein A2289_09685 [Deltaproteobacteria bacterium RIFOXYA12_FULL_58_15]OGR13695.1 MAG: hypothetical protein A2341_21260 [Deltaproteobacteria bacterium RIFOXYB12_FULL_58_9]
MKQLAPVVLLVATMVTPRDSYAQLAVTAPATDTLLSSTITELSHLLALETMEATDIASTLTHLVEMVRTANEALAVARAVKEAYEVLKDYSLEDLAQDAMLGLNEAMPELMGETQMLMDQGMEVAENGAVGFWSYRNIHDGRMHDYLRGAAELAIKGSIYPAIFGTAGITGSHDPITESDKLVAFHFAQRGQLYNRATRNAAKGYIAKKIEALVNQAEKGDQLDLQIEATAAQAAVGAEQSLEFLAAAKHEEIADGMRRQFTRQAIDEATRRDLSEGVGEMFQIGVVE